MSGPSPYFIADLFFFESVARLGSFSAAAEELCVTQGAVSQRVRSLEERLGYALLRRTTRRVMLTERGGIVFQSVNRARSELSEALASAARIGQAPKLVVSCLPSLAMEWLIPRIQRLYRLLGEVDVRIRAEYHHPVPQEFSEGEITLAIRYDPQEHRELEVCYEVDEPVVPVCSPSFLAQHPGKDAFALLKTGFFLHDSEPWSGGGPSEEWTRWFHAKRRPFPDFGSSRYFNLSQLAIKACVDGQGIALGRGSLVEKAIADGELVALDGEPVSIGAKYRVMSNVVPAKDSPEASFIAWFAAELKGSQERFLERVRNGGAV